jgi:hypothetical protein
MEPVLVFVTELPKVLQGKMDANQGGADATLQEIKGEMIAKMETQHENQSR